MEGFLTRVGKLQVELKAPKGQTNKFGGYKYRSCEDILEAVKPLLDKHRLVLTVGDDLINYGAAITSAQPQRSGTWTVRRRSRTALTPGRHRRRRAWMRHKSLAPPPVTPVNTP